MRNSPFLSVPLVYVQVTLTPGVYLVIPTTTGCCFESAVQESLAKATKTQVRR